jgi:hypothetical protein
MKLRKRARFCVHHSWGSNETAACLLLILWHCTGRHNTVCCIASKNNTASDDLTGKMIVSGSSTLYHQILCPTPPCLAGARAVHKVINNDSVNKLSSTFSRPF